MRRGQRWEVVLSAAARDDLADITRFTRQRFGDRQAMIYLKALKETLKALRAGPGQPLTQPAPLAGVHALRMGGRGRHVVYFRAEAEATPPTIAVLRILHDGMDAPRHLSPEANTEDGLPA